MTRQATLALFVVFFAAEALADAPVVTFNRHENLRCKEPVGSTLRGDPVIVTTEHPGTVERIEDFVLNTSQGPLPFWRTRKGNGFAAHINGVKIPYPLGYLNIGTSQYAMWLHNYFSYVEVPSKPEMEEWDGGPSHPLTGRKVVRLRILTRYGTHEEFLVKEGNAGQWAVPASLATTSRFFFENDSVAYYYDGDGVKYKYSNAGLIWRQSGGVETFRALLLERAESAAGQELFRLEYGSVSAASECGNWITENEPFLKRIIPPGGKAVELTYKAKIPRPACENEQQTLCSGCTPSNSFEHCAEAPCAQGSNAFGKCACVLDSAKLEGTQSYLARWTAEARWFEETPPLYPCVPPGCSTYYRRTTDLDGVAVTTAQTGFPLSGTAGVFEAKSVGAAFDRAYPVNNPSPNAVPQRNIAQGPVECRVWGGNGLPPANPSCGYLGRFLTPGSVPSWGLMNWWYGQSKDGVELVSHRWRINGGLSDSVPFYGYAGTTADWNFEREGKIVTADGTGTWIVREDDRSPNGVLARVQSYANVCQAGYDPQVGVRAVAWRGRSSGEGVRAGAGLEENIRFTPDDTAAAGPQVVERTEANLSLSSGGWLVAGAAQTVGATEFSTPSGNQCERGELNREVASLEPSGVWTTYGLAQSTPEFVETSDQFEGATDYVGSSSLRWTGFKYDYLSDRQFQSQQEEVSAVPGQPAKRLTYARDGNGRLEHLIEEGSTYKLSGLVERVWRHTFYKTSRACHSPAADHRGRTLRIEGPCMGSPSTPSCPNITEMEYYADGLLNESGRLKKVIRYTAGCGSPSLVTEMLAYDQLGQPTLIRRPDSTQEEFEYRGNHLVRRKDVSSGNQWEYRWRADRLTGVLDPEGEWNVFCYGTLTHAGCSPPYGTQLNWHARALDEAGANWTERVEYSYGSDKTLHSETYRTRDPVTQATTISRVVSHESNARRDHTFTGMGSLPSGNPAFTLPELKDESGKVRARAPAFGNPLPLCLTQSGAIDSVCHQLQYDRLERVAEVTLKTTPSTGIKACIDYDTQGNIKAVFPACNGICAVNQPTASSTCANGAPAKYLWDDFGNVTAFLVEGAATDWTRLTFDGRGNVVKKQTAAMRVDTQPWNQYTYDDLDRLLAVDLVQPNGSATRLLTQVWDVPQGCGPFSQVYTTGRLSLVQDPVWATYFSYDSEGRVVSEFKKRPGAACPSAIALDDTPSTFYRYRRTGLLQGIDYPHGRWIDYSYWPSAPSRVQTVSTGLPGGSPRVLVDNVRWESFGGVESYDVISTSGSAIREVRYAGGQASVPPTSPCGSASTLSDLSNRNRFVFVSETGGSPGDVFRLTTTYQGEVPVRVDRCYLKADGNTDHFAVRTPTGANPGYDLSIRLLGQAGTTSGPSTWWDSGGTADSWSFSYDDRGNRVRSSFNVGNGVGERFVRSELGSAQRDRLTLSGLEVPQSNPPIIDASTHHKRSYIYDADGRVTEFKNPDGSHRVRLGYNFGADATFAWTQVGSVFYSYFYDGQSRRTRKEYPTGSADEYFWSLNRELLEDRGLSVVTESHKYAVDEYVWLAGRPIAMIRSAWGHGRPRAANGANCGRLDDGVSCGEYFVVTDQLAKPVLMLDSNGLITGSGEYQPFGHVNRVPQDAESAHPSPHNVNSYWQRFTQPRLGLQLGMRMHLELDVDPWGDSVTIEEQQPDMSWFQFGNAYSGSAMGLVWTDWSVTSQGQASEQRLRFASDNYSCPPSGPCSVVWPYNGFTMPDYEYRRYQTSAVWTPLRFPGQYHDTETDLFENWHRYYSPDTGRYLSPEPLLQDPEMVNTMARQGLPMPAYAYGLNNPVSYVDRDGRLVWTLPIVITLYGAEISAGLIALGVGVGAGVAVSTMGPPPVRINLKSPEPKAEVCEPEPSCQQKVTEIRHRIYMACMLEPDQAARDACFANNWPILCDLIAECYGTIPSSYKKFCKQQL